MDTLKNLITGARTQMQELPMKAGAISTPTLAKSSHHHDWAFETFGDAQLIAMLTAARDFSEAMRKGDNPRWLSLIGTSGAGKTHLARCINRDFQRYVEGELIPRQDPFKTQRRAHGGFLSWRKLTDELRNGDYGRFNVACSDYFVALDDIGAEYSTPFVLSKLDALCDARQRKWTVLTANLSMQQIHDDMSARIASRLLRNGSVIVDVDVTDWNLRRSAA